MKPHVSPIKRANVLNTQILFKRDLCSNPLLIKALLAQRARLLKTIGGKEIKNRKAFLYIN